MGSFWVFLFSAKIIYAVIGFSASILNLSKSMVKKFEKDKTIPKCINTDKKSGAK